MDGVAGGMVGGRMGRRAFLGGALAGMLAGGAAAPARAQGAPCRLVYFHDYAPFSWSDADGTVRGLFVDVLAETLGARMGIPLVHQGWPWSRAQAMVRAGEADGFCSVATAERRAYAAVSTEPLVLGPVKLFVPRGAEQRPEIARARRLEDLKGLRLAIYIGSSWAHERLADLVPDMVQEPDMAGALRLVAGGRVDGIVDMADVLRHRVKALGLGLRIAETAPVLDTVPFHLCVSRTSPLAPRMAEFDAALRAIRRDGTYAALTRRIG